MRKFYEAGEIWEKCCPFQKKLNRTSKLFLCFCEIGSPFVA